MAVLVGGFLKSYLSKKGDNLATKEDIRDLVAQMKLMTRTAEEIKTEASDAAWDRQKRWELKRDTVFETARKVADETEAMTRLVGIYSTEKMNIVGHMYVFGGPWQLLHRGSVEEKHCKYGNGDQPREQYSPRPFH